MIQWEQEVEKRKDDFLDHLKAFLRIKSVLNESEKTNDQPFGPGVDRALKFLLEQGEQDGFTAKNIDGYAGHLEFGEGDEVIGILCHVDVVPEGDGWTTPPFEPDIRDGKIYARGAIDDKGPTMAAYYAMKIIKDLGVPLHKRVRMIIGCDEESQWRCVDHYAKKEEMPKVGFAPDADFPIIHAEKGICDFEFTQTINQNQADQASLHLVSLDSGRRLNMVPDYAKATISGASLEQVKEAFLLFLNQEQLRGKASIDGQMLELILEGKSAHGMEPKNGINAGLKMVHVLNTLAIDEQAKSFLQFVDHYFYEDSRGKALHIQTSDDISGDLTLNVGRIQYSDKTGGNMGVNMRYPVTAKSDDILASLQQTVQNEPLSFKLLDDSKPHYVKEDHPLIETLKRVYEERTGEKATLLAIGGGTYARALEAGVAFGALFPNEDEVAHQKDEYADINGLLKAMAIYAQAIYELTR